MQFPIPRFEFLLAQEQGVVEEGQGVEDVEVGVFGFDEGGVDEGLEAGC